MNTRFKLKSKLLVTATIVFCIVFGTGLVLRLTGPVKISSHLSVTSQGSDWLVFFKSPAREPLFNLMVGFSVEDYVVVTGYRTHPLQVARWFLGEDAVFVRTRYVDESGIARYLTTDFRIPGIFYLNYRSPDYGVLTLALRWWFVLGFPGFFPGLWIAGRIRNKLKESNNALVATTAGPEQSTGL